MNMKRKGIISSIFLSLLFVLVIYKIDDITDFIIKYINSTPEVVLPSTNEYARGESYGFVSNTDSFIPYGKQDLINIFYTFLDRGYENFTFYCPEEYVECVDDMTNIINDQSMITDIGNFVHPFNNFHDVYLSTSSSGEINLKISKTYDDASITKVNDEIDKIIAEVKASKYELKDQILEIHDYIIDHTYYDENASDATNAYNLFFEGKTKCFGYADAMALFLDKLGVKNIKIGSKTHVWNLVYIDDEWLHLDVTWDDPVVESGASITNNIRHKFYMIDTDTLHSYDTNEHDFNELVYVEAKK